MVVNKVIKYLLCTFNFLFFMGGILIFSFSAHVKINQAQYQITDELLPAVHLLIFIGATTLVFGFLGCCGAVRENRCLLTVFFKGLLVMFIMLSAVGVLGVVSRTAAAQELVRRHMEQMIPLSEQPKEVQESYQNVERSGFCCGFFDGHLDWGNDSVVPDSCNCTDTTRNCTVLNGREIYATPCMTYFMTWLDRMSDAFMATAFGFGFLMILAMVFSLLLLCQTRTKGVI